MMTKRFGPCIWLSLTTLLLAEVKPASFVMNRGGVIVVTKLGRVSGTIETIGVEDGYQPLPNDARPSRLFASFKGIPYAKPPVGKLRWKDPIPHGPWNDNWDATNFGSLCPQINRVTGQVIGDENCLFLNIYTPYDPILGRSDEVSRKDDVNDFEDVQKRLNVKDLLPVMVWFHGGGYSRGGSQQFGPQFLMREDVVVVTVNYRLGVLGFLSTGMRNLPGNYGMLDQVESLKWVRSHISSFGGDPDRVTIFGESAGGSITHLLSLSPLSEGLFNQAIMQSASALCPWSIELDPLDYARSVASRLDCPYEAGALVSCLRERDADQLIRVQTELLRYSLFPVRTAPVVDAGFRDEPFLPDLPVNIIKNGRYRSIPMVMGVNPNEGFLFYLWIYYENMAKMSNRAFLEHELFPGVLASMLKNSSHLDQVSSFVRKQYGLLDIGDSTAFVARFSQVVDDAMFTSCVYNAQLMTAKTSSAPLYAYLFSYKGEETPSYSSTFGDLVKSSGFDHPLLNTGVTHADELLYLFRMAGYRPSYSPLDMKVSQLMTRLWTNFAKTGNPLTGIPQPGVSLWPRVSSTTDEVLYLNINASNMNLGVDFRKAETNFWTNVVPHVQSVAETYHESNVSSLTTVWSLLTLFIVAIASVAFLIGLIIAKQRRRRYPESNVVLQRSAPS